MTRLLARARSEKFVILDENTLLENEKCNEITSLTITLAVKSLMKRVLNRGA